MLISDGAPIYIMTEKGKNFRLSRDWEYLHPDLGTIKVEKGYKSDLASVPLLFWWWQWGKWNVGAIAHDYIYEEGRILADGKWVEMKKAEADNLFYQILQEVGVPPLTSFLMYLAVRLFGRGNFDPNISD